MRRPRKRRHETQVLLLTSSAAAPAVLVALTLLRAAQLPEKLKWVLGTVVIGAWLWGTLALLRRVVSSLQSVSSLLAALRSGDFSVRGHLSGRRGALDEVLGEINGLGDTLRSERTGAVEASALLAKVMSEIDVAVFAFNRTRQLKLVNRAGQRLLSHSTASVIDASAQELGLAELLEGPTPRTVDLRFAGCSGQWELRRNTFRLEGLPHELLVLADLRRALREEERQAWQRLIRVMGHEINNSLAPIRSLAASFQDMLRMPAAERPATFEQDLGRGLAVIDRRSEALARFLEAYARLAKLPAPRLGPVDVAAWVHRVVELEQGARIRIMAGPKLTIQADGDQLDQLLINLVRNAVDAANETGGGVEVRWRKLSRYVEMVVLDEGPGISDTHNLFVPFFTTKASGSGIGLVLSRQICDGHAGTLTLESRRDRQGAVARLLLPL